MKALAKLKKLLGDVRGSVDPIEGIIMFAGVAVVIYVLFPILGGVQSATPEIAETSPLYNASTTAQTTIASGAGLISLETLIIAAVVLISTVLLIRKSK